MLIDLPVCAAEPLPVHPGPVSADCLLVDGSIVTLRAARPEDWTALVALHDRSSERTRYLRFFGVHPRLSTADAIHFVTVDHDQREALVVLHDGVLIGLGGYDGVDPRSAEVAFLVDDDYQGRGVGSLLLEHLAVLARGRGLRRFVAEVLATNHAMLDVFSRAGFDESRTLEQGVVELSLDLDDATVAHTVAHDRERVAAAASVARVMRPRSILLIAGDLDTEGPGRVLLTRLTAGFVGTLHTVELAGPAREGVVVHDSWSDLPSGIDLAIATVPADEAAAAVANCAAAGVHALSLQSDAPTLSAQVRRRWAAELREAAHRGGVRLVGPGAAGPANPSIGLRSLPGGVPMADGAIGVLSQSASVARTVTDELAARSLGISSALGVGLKVDVSGNDLLQYWTEDADTAVALLHLESFGNPHTFARLARTLAPDKPVVVVRAAPLHDATTAEADAATSALFEQLGVIDVASVEEMVDVAELLVTQPRPAGRRVAVVADTRGLGLIADDECADAGLSVSPVLGTVRGAVASDIRAALADPEVDAVVIVVDWATTHSVLDLPPSTTKPILAVWRGATRVALRSRDASHDEGVPAMWFSSIRAAAAALARVATYQRWVSQPAGAPARLDDVDRHAARDLVCAGLPTGPDPVSLPSDDASSILATYGIASLPANPLTTSDEATLALDVSIERHPQLGTVLTITPTTTSGFLRTPTRHVLPLGELEATRLALAVTRDANDRPPADVGALQDVFLRISALLEDNPEITDLRLAPLLAGPRVLAVAPRVRLQAEADPWDDLARHLRRDAS